MKIEKLPSGSFRCRVEIGKDLNGKRKWKSITGPDRNSVKRRAMEYQLRSSGAQSDTFGQAMEEYIAMRSSALSPATIREYKRTKARIEAQFPGFYHSALYSLEAKDLQDIVNALLRAGNAPKTVRDRLGVISSVLRSKDVYLGKITLPQRDEKQILVPTESEIKKIIGLSRGTVLEIPFMLAATAGLRRGEVCALTWEDIDFKKRTLIVSKDMVMGPDKEWHIKPPKTSASRRIVVLPKEVCSRIKKLEELPELTPTTLTHRVTKFMKVNGFPYHFHSLRHFCASYMHGIGVPDAYTMQRCGWENDKVLKQIYRHTLADQEKMYIKMTNKAMGFLGKM